MADVQWHHLNRFKGWERQAATVICTVFIPSYSILEYCKIIGKSVTCSLKKKHWEMAFEWLHCGTFLQNFPHLDLRNMFLSLLVGCHQLVCTLFPATKTAGYRVNLSPLEVQTAICEITAPLRRASLISIQGSCRGLWLIALKTFHTVLPFILLSPAVQHISLCSPSSYTLHPLYALLRDHI